MGLKIIASAVGKFGGKLEGQVYEVLRREYTSLVKKVSEQTGLTDFTMEILDVSYPNRKRISVTVTSSDRRFVIKRTFEEFPGKPVKLTNDLFMLSKDLQGKNIANMVNRHGLATLRAFGGHEIRVHANIDIGGYAWLRKGFVPDSWTGITRFINKSTAVSSSFKQKWSKLSDSQRRVFVLSDAFRAAKPALLGTDWYGTADTRSASIVKALIGEPFNETPGPAPTPAPRPTPPPATRPAPPPAPTPPPAPAARRPRPSRARAAVAARNAAAAPPALPAAPAAPERAPRRPRPSRSRAARQARAAASAGRFTPEGQVLHDSLVRFQVYLERLKVGEMRGMDKGIRKMDTTIQALLNSTGDAPSQAKLNVLLAQMRQQMGVIATETSAAHLQALEKFSAYAAEFHLQTVGLVVPPTAPALEAVPTAAAWAGALTAPIQATGALMEPFVATWGRSAIAKVEGAVRTGYAQGKTTQQIVQVIRGTQAAGYRDGLLGGVIKREANAMVRTSLQHVSSSAQQLVYETNEDVVDGYIWISTLDSRTSDTCQALDLQEFKVGHGPVPPIHINCRSTTIPKIKGVDLLSETTRSSKGDEGGQQVPASQSYFSWLQTQPASFQDDALGPTRAALLRQGGLSADEFARLSLDKNFQPLTLEEMRKKDPGAFERAGITP